VEGNFQLGRRLSRRTHRMSSPLCDASGCCDSAGNGDDEVVPAPLESQVQVTGDPAASGPPISRRPWMGDGSS
jgi:hypothetical protein